MKAATKASQAKVALALSLLSVRPMSAVQVAAALNCLHPQASIYLRALRDAGCIYLCAWAKGSDPRVRIPMYQVGDLPDAPRPRKLTDKEVNKRYWSRLRKDTDRYLTVTRHHRAKRIQPPKIAATWLSALGA